MYMGRPQLEALYSTLRCSLSSPLEDFCHIQGLIHRGALQRLAEPQRKTDPMALEPLHHNSGVSIWAPKQVQVRDPYVACSLDSPQDG